MSGLVRYPLQLAGDRWVTLLMPSNLTAADVERIVQLLRSLVAERHEG